MRASRRLQKEEENFSKDNTVPLHLEVVSNSVWLITFCDLSNTIYAGETHQLKVTFFDNYPIESPEVVFVAPGPDHPHIYSNGHICLNILYDDWTPALTIKAVCFSIYSMLASADAKGRPEDNFSYTSVVRPSPKRTKFMFHDDTV